MKLVFKILIGLLSAGLTPGMIASIIYLLSPRYVSFVYSGVLTIFIISLLHVALFVVPAFLLGWYFNRIRAWTILFISFIIGALPTAIFLRVMIMSNPGTASVDNTMTMINGVMTSAGLIINLELISVMGLFGLSGGIVFLIIWHFWIYPDTVVARDK